MEVDDNNSSDFNDGVNKNSDTPKEQVDAHQPIDPFITDKQFVTIKSQWLIIKKSRKLFRDHVDSLYQELS